jgi:hypothetical protein
VARFNILELDRRLIFLLIFLAVLTPLFLPAPKTVKTSPEVKKVYDRIEALPAGTIVMLACEYDPSTSAEMSPVTVVVLRQCFRKNLRVLVSCSLPNGVSLVESEILRVAAEYKKKNGVDYVYLGYKPYLTPTILAMGENFRLAFPSDFYNTRLDDIPMMNGVKNYQDVALVLAITSTIGIDSWIIYGQGRYHFPLAAAASAVMAPNYYNYLDSGQLFGLIGGLRGAAEYEQLAKRPAAATKGMLVQSVCHLLIVGLIVLGNVSFFIGRRRRRPQE